MKKIIFTALAAVAISGVSLAGTTVKATKKVKKVVKKEVVKSINCDEYAQAAVEHFQTTFLMWPKGELEKVRKIGRASCRERV